MSSMVWIRCPVTDRAVATGILMTRTAFRVLRTKNTDVRCAGCGGVHAWQGIGAWLARVHYPTGAQGRKTEINVVQSLAAGRSHQAKRSGYTDRGDLKR